MTAAGKE